MNETRTLTAEEAQEAGAAIEQLLRSFPVIVAAIPDETADLIARGLAASEAALNRRATFMPIAGAVGLPMDGEDEDTKRANIAICRKVLELRQAVKDAVRVSAEADERKRTLAENRRQIAALLGLDGAA